MTGTKRQRKETRKEKKGRYRVKRKERKRGKVFIKKE